MTPLPPHDGECLESSGPAQRAWVPGKLLLVVLSAGACGLLILSFTWFWLGRQGKTDQPAAAGDGKAESPESADPERTCPYQLTLALDEPFDERSLSLRVEVANIGSKAFAWDKDFAVFLRFGVMTDKDKEKVPTAVHKLPRPQPADLKRFIKLASGEKQVTHVHLTQGFKSFFIDAPVCVLWPVNSRPSLPADAIYEESVKYDFSDVTNINILLEYAPNWFPLYERWFGIDLEQLGFSQEACISNEIVLQRNKQGRLVSVPPTDANKKRPKLRAGPPPYWKIKGDIVDYSPP
jgi:hypothetical protein